MGQPFSSPKPKGRYLEELHKKVPDINIDEIMDYYRQFKDISRGKRLKRKDFIKVYKKVFGGKAAELADNIFNAFDINGDGRVDFEEFLIGLSVTDYTGNDRDSRVKKMKWAFSVYDKDRSGTIDRAEMAAIVSAVFGLTGSLPDKLSKISPEEFANELFSEVDENGDGEITFEEFVKAADKSETLIDLLLPAPPEIDELTTL